MDANKTGALIAAKRKEKGMTQRELAEKLHISNKAVSRWETGAGFPDVSLLEPLAEALDVTVTELLSGGEEAQPGEALVVESTRHFSREIKENRKKVPLAALRRRDNYYRRRVDGAGLRGQGAGNSSPRRELRYAGAEHGKGKPHSRRQRRARLLLRCGQGGRRERGDHKPGNMG
jgi:transcriptional regulator with XRE-family HTH domain